MKTALLLAFTPFAITCATLGACSSSSSGGAAPGTDAGDTTDTGTASPDSGTGTDSGGGPSDAGSDTSTPPDDGGPIIAPTEDWTWVPVSGAKCRDGSDTGFAVNINPASTKVMIYMEGGGACFNAITCGTNPSTFGSSEFTTWKGRTHSGVLDRTDAKNAAKDWSYVYVPYCTGDVHAGNNPAATVAGLPAAQAFVGYTNVASYLKRIVPTFASTTQVLLTGISAGGFGAAANYDQVQAAFGAVPVDMLDDSGPMMEDPYLAACLQSSFKTLWALDKTVIAACGADCATAENYLLAYLLHETKAHTDRKFGLMDSTGDNTISSFFGFGASNCTSYAALTPAVFEAGLDDIRSQLTGQANFGTFYFTGTDHTTLGNPAFDTRTAGAVNISDWFGSFVTGTVSNAGP